MKSLLFVILSVATFYAYAQTAETPQKIGHADWEYIFNRLPEHEKIERDLKNFETQLKQQLNAKNQELEVKYKAYQAMPADIPDPVKNSKETELAYLQESIQRFQQDAQISMQKKQTDLVKPVFEKIGKAIEEAALENGFSYIINSRMIGTGDVLIFADEQYNISDLVLKKLGESKKSN